jgi:hypothetical protein
MSSTNLKTVQSIYEAFGRGDVEAILAQLTDDVDWAAESEAALAPWHGHRHGRQEVIGFFSGIAQSLQVDEFTPMTFAANDSDVLVVIRFGVTSLETGRSGSMNIHHWWRFREGKVCFYRGSEDTAMTAHLLGLDVSSRSAAH